MSNSTGDATRLLHVALPRARNTQQNTMKHATGHTTGAQKNNLKALAQRVLARNSAGNSRATTSEKACNKPCNTRDTLLHGQSVADQPDPSTATEPFNREAMDAIQHGEALPVWSELLSEWLYWVRGEKKRNALRAQGCELPIYTLGELAVVVQHDPEDVKTLHAVKRTFNGMIQPIRRRTVFRLSPAGHPR